jgi:uncharacterized membrane protein YphA (DoxX/SURF4 family)
MKIATTIIRVLLGLIFIYASSMFFLKLAPETHDTGYFKVFEVGLIASTYLIPLTKLIELLCGIAFLTNKFVTLANIVILPVTVNILCINLLMMSRDSKLELPLAIFIFLANLFLIFRYWKNYKTVFTI